MTEAKPAEHEPAREEAGSSAREPLSFADALAEQARALAELEHGEQALEALRAEERDLEVRRIEAEVALESSRERPAAAPRGPSAVALVEALAETRALEAALETIGETAVSANPQAARAERERLEEAVHALRTWLEASRATPGAIPRSARATLAAACVAIVAGALVLHPIVLLLLAPVGVLFALLRLRGQDTAWIRLGAERRFAATGHEPPHAWREAEVRARLGELERTRGELEARLQAEAQAPPEETARVAEQADARAAREELELGARLAGAEERLQHALDDCRLDRSRLDEALERWLGLVRRAEHARRDLEAAKARRHAASADAERLRERLIAFLRRHGEPPAGGRADSAALGESLERLRRSRERTNER